MTEKDPSNKETMPPDFEQIAKQATSRRRSGEHPAAHNSSEVLENNIDIAQKIDEALDTSKN